MEAHSTPRSRLTYAEYRCFPEDGRRHEIIDGEHYVNPAPTTYHQTVSRRLLVQLYNQVELSGLGEVFYAPTDVHLSEGDVVQPDLLVVLDEHRTIITPTKIKGAPDLVIEILSESSTLVDRTLKKELYRRSGVAEYWIVDPFEHIVEQYALRGDRYELLGRQASEVVSSRIPDVRVDLMKVW